jgi:pyruvate dehydrogenase E1 component alpha subunit
MGEGVSTQEDLDAIQAEIKADAADAVAYALAAKYPDATEVDMHVFVENA